MKIKELQDGLMSGDNPYINVANIDRVLLHYVEEVGELIHSIRKNASKEEIEKELGDNMILLAFVAGALRLDLEACTLKKVHENIRKGKFKPEKHSKEFAKVIALKDEIDTEILHKEIEKALGE